MQVAFSFTAFLQEQSANDHQQPRERPAGIAQLRSTSEGAQKALLNQVIGKVGIAAQMTCESIQAFRTGDPKAEYLILRPPQAPRPNTWAIRMPSSGPTASRFNRASLVDFSLALSALQRRWVPGEERDVVERILCDPLGHSPCLGGICADHQDPGVVVVHRQAPVVLRLLHVGKSKPTRAWNG